MCSLYSEGHLATYCSKWVIDWQKLSTGSCKENSVATFGMKKPKKFKNSFFCSFMLSPLLHEQKSLIFHYCSNFVWDEVLFPKSPTPSEFEHQIT